MTATRLWFSVIAVAVVPMSSCRPSGAILLAKFIVFCRVAVHVPCAMWLLVGFGVYIWQETSMLHINHVELTMGVQL